MADDARTDSFFLNFVAGLCLGTLTGTLVGLTTTGVVSTVLSTVVAIITAFLGIGGELKFFETSSAPIRVIGFSLAMTIALVSGIWLRSHQALSPTPIEIVRQLTAAGYSTTEARDLARLVRFGLKFEGVDPISEEAVAGSIKQTQTSLYSSTASRCNDLNRDKSLSAQTQIDRLATYGGAYANIAFRLRNQPVDRQVTLLSSATFYLCGAN
jgi:hypothetical protein